MFTDNIAIFIKSAYTFKLFTSLYSVVLLQMCMFDNHFKIWNEGELHTKDTTIPFIARYRKEPTGNLDV